MVAILQSCTNPVVVTDDVQLLQARWADHARCLVNSPAATQWSMSDPVPPWIPDWKSLIVRLYTSGSTGTPAPQTRTLEQLARGALVLGYRLDEEIVTGLASINRIICSVPPQHMFGLETSVMLSLVHGIAVVDRRPLLPADVKAVFELVGASSIWITTPLHLRALVRSGEHVPNCRVVVASTVALDAVVAAQSETLTQAPVLEIYGSTETGVVAMRRTARDTRWRPVREQCRQPLRPEADSGSSAALRAKCPSARQGIGILRANLRPVREAPAGRSRSARPVQARSCRT